MMNIKNFDPTTSGIVKMIKSIYDPKSYHLLSKQKISKTILYLLMLSLIINLFTVILPYAPTVFGNGGIKHILEILVPDFTYTNGVVDIPDYKCDIDEEKNTIAMIDTSKELHAEILTPYNSGYLIGQTSVLIKSDDGTITNIIYKNYLPLNQLDKETLISFKTMSLIYTGLILIVLFSITLTFLMLLVGSCMAYVFLTLLNLIIFRVKFKHKFRSIFNIAAYRLCGATILKSFLASFNIAPLPFKFNHWITIVQCLMCNTIAVLAIIDIKKHKEANSKLREEHIFVNLLIMQK